MRGRRRTFADSRRLVARCVRLRGRFRCSQTCEWRRTCGERLGGRPCGRRSDSWGKTNAVTPRHVAFVTWIVCVGGPTLFSERNTHKPVVPPEVTRSTVGFVWYFNLDLNLHRPSSLFPSPIPSTQGVRTPYTPRVEPLRPRPTDTRRARREGIRGKV